MIENSQLEQKLEKLKAKLPESFLDEVKVMNENGMKDTALKYAKEMENIDDNRKADSKLQAIIEQKKDLDAGYKDAKKFSRMKMQYVLATMKLNGV
jgi:hypothetical protein